MREITHHRSDAPGDINNAISVKPHVHVSRAYHVSRVDTGATIADVLFTGPRPSAVKDNGVPYADGVTLEVLLAICLDRLEEFQGTDFACRENFEAIGHIRRALGSLHDRTHNRQKQKVIGTMSTHKQAEDRIAVGTVTVAIGGTNLDASKLKHTWGYWQEAESAAKKLDPPITDEEVATLGEIPQTSAAKNGFREFRQAVTQTR